MVERNPVEVTVEIDGQETAAGTLWLHDRGGQSATFRYTDAYLTNPAGYDLDPALARAAGVFHTPPRSAIFNAFADSAPDRWGENLMRREERERARAAKTTPRTLGKADFLLGVRDDTRQGCVRFRKPATATYYSTHRHAVPRLIDLARLMRAADRVRADGDFDRDLADLIDAGSSLGGARPKAAVRDVSGRLSIAKFPRSDSDEWDVAGWEEVQLRLARRAGLTVAESELLTVAGRHVLLLSRFDRIGARRLGFASALTMLEASDGDLRSYLEIAEVIERYSPRADADLRELYRRILFSILTGNTDDHLRNHAFLRERDGWALSPAYDLNPNPDNPARLSTAVDLDNTDASLDVALSVGNYFRLSPPRARDLVREVETATSGWRQAAAELGIPKSQADRMAVAYESEQRRIARALRVL
ncbi:HipA domain-containing protein [Pseudofrankia sp. BMG5.36]|uniref:type II toxin-antitoxin system HipA family toxin n=1 Tax=Pseudofrankia sp. BMG5.36 TaxID=1834512 RepID=UPI0008DAC6DC|nr:HipA domain-containing protein [Pseudofrankia sp. BMG5.36]OHV47123.1 phosphatidylinositol kinase [Pseudofrankia sp. BMG5.36]